MLFELYLSKHSFPEWKENYINYHNLKKLIEDIINKKINSEKNFLLYLESEWNKYINFYNKQLKLLYKEEIKKSLIKDIIKLNQFAYLNQTAVRKIIKKHDKLSKNKLYPGWIYKIKYKTYKQMFPLLKQISDIYQNQKKKNYDDDIKIEIDQKNFVRKSFKFWVRPEHIIDVISHIIVYLPIYTFDKDSEMLGQIDSVYLDNEDHYCYNTRLIKQQGSKLVRIRWYNDEKEKVFIERKIHCESWTLEKSEKNRFIIDENKVLSFLKGIYTPKLNDNNLSSTVQNFVLDKKLIPIIRTSYKRIAFQLENSNDIRISLDTDISMIKETISHLEWFTSYENLKDNNIHRFPFSILEIKLKGNFIDNPPTWIQKLMSSEKVIEVPKFSKFIHTNYIFFEGLKPPYWIDAHDEYFKDLPKSSGANIINKNNKKSKKQVVQQIKVEPKTHFANERTYLQWFNASSFICVSGIAIFEFSHESKISAIIMIIFGLLMAIYSMFIYYYRMNGLFQHRVQIYSDSWGPLFMTIGMIITIILSAIFR